MPIALTAPLAPQRAVPAPSAPPALAHSDELLIGAMSGTSLDGVDAVLAQFAGPRMVAVLAHASTPLHDALRAELLALNQPGGVDELARAARAANALALAYAQTCAPLFEHARTLGHPVLALGAHGQTVRHQPQALSEAQPGYTLQLINPALLAERTGCCVVADFRSRDVAAGGQGAPLVPAFHQALWGCDGVARGVLNVGGMANLSCLPAAPQAPVLGFDCGPGNVLMDAWCQRHRSQPFDAGGAWARSGAAHPELLAQLLADPYFALPPPKSTGREHFSLAWLDAALANWPDLPAATVQATLLELTASACAASVVSYAFDSTEVVVCGGGAFNTALLQRLQALLPAQRVRPSDALGLPAQQVEAAAFAWLAQQTRLGLVGNLPSVTGARGPRVLGAIYPA